MPLSKKELKALKRKMAESDPDALKKIKANSKLRKKVKKEIIRNETYMTGENRRQKTRLWNFKVNQVVYVHDYMGKVNLGLIISDKEYFKQSVKENCFFVLVDSTVRMINGNQIRSLPEV
tara:strand:+ start:1224 stop:1583 length:360 start_codon:yes stop_codon:yes gene_type:complete